MFSLIRYYPKKKIISVLLVVALLAGGIFLLRRNIFRAEGMPFTLSGKVYGVDTKSPLADVSFTLSPVNYILDTEPITATSQADGSYSISAPDGTFTSLLIQKDGYFDINASIYNSTSQGSIPLNLTLKPGFGEEEAQIIPTNAGTQNAFGLSILPSDDSPFALQTTVASGNSYTTKSVYGTWQNFDLNQGKMTSNSFGASGFSTRDYQPFDLGTKLPFSISNTTAIYCPDTGLYYLIGGTINNVPTGDIYAVDRNHPEEAYKVANLPEARQNPGAIYIQEKHYILIAARNLMVFDPFKNKVYALMNFPEASRYQIFRAKDALYFLLENNDAPSTTIYTLPISELKDLPDPCIPAENCSLSDRAPEQKGSPLPFVGSIPFYQTGDSFFLLGGYNKDRVLNTAKKINLDTLEATDATITRAMPQPMAYAATMQVQAEGSMFLLGGVTDFSYGDHKLPTDKIVKVQFSSGNLVFAELPAKLPRNFSSNIFAQDTAYRTYMFDDQGILKYSPSLKLRPGEYYTLNPKQNTTLLIKGEPKEGALEITAKNTNPLYFGAQNTAQTKLSSLSVKDGETEYDLVDAANSNLIQKSGKFKGATLDLSEDAALNTDFQAGDYLSLTPVKSGITITQEANHANDYTVALPPSTNLDDVVWAAAVDPDSLSDADYERYLNIKGPIFDATIDQVNAKSSENAAHNPVIMYSFHGKKIGQDVDISYQPLLANSNQTIQPAATSPRRGQQGEPFEVPKEIKLTLKYVPGALKIYKLKSLPWPETLSNSFKDEMTKLYPKMVSVVGLPNQDFTSQVFGVKDIEVHRAQLGEFTAGFYAPFFNDMVLDSDEFATTWNDDNRAILAHETMHGFDDPYEGDLPDSLVEAQNTYREKLVVPDSANARLLGYMDAVYKYYNYPQMLASEENWDKNHCRFYDMYSLSGAAYSQIYAQQPDFFKRWNQLAPKYFVLNKKSKIPIDNYILPPAKLYLMLLDKDLIPNGLDHYSSFHDWLKNQWAGAYTIEGRKGAAVNSYSGQIWIHSVPFLTGSAAGENIFYYKITDNQGTFENRSFYVDLTMFKSYMLNNVKKTEKVASERKIYVDHLRNKPAPVNFLYIFNHEVQPQRKYTITNTIKYLKNKNYHNEYVGIPADTLSVGIFGVVAEVWSSSVFVTPIKPSLPTKEIPVQDGYFETTDNAYGRDAGVYKVTYYTQCGKERNYFIAKDEGTSFLQIRTGKTTLPGQTTQSNSFFGKVAEKLGIKKVAAEDQCTVSPMDIQDIKATTQADGSEKVTFKTTEPALIQFDWGETTEYDKTADDTPDEELLNHAVILSPVTPGTTYHFNITAMSSEGIPDEEAGTVSEEEEGNAPVEAKESGDQTFTAKVQPPQPPTSVQVKNITQNSATVQFEDNAPQGLRAYVKYGPDTNYGQEVHQDWGPQSPYWVDLSGLTPNTTYHFQLGTTNQGGDIGTASWTPDQTFTTSSDIIVSNICNYEGMTAFETNVETTGTYTVRKYQKNPTTGQYEETCTYSAEFDKYSAYTHYAASTCAYCPTYEGYSTTDIKVCRFSNPQDCYSFQTRMENTASSYTCETCLGSPESAAQQAGPVTALQADASTGTLSFEANAVSLDENKQATTTPLETEVIYGTRVKKLNQSVKPEVKDKKQIVTLPNLKARTYHYQIITTDKDGNKHYSDIKTLKHGNGFVRFFGDLWERVKSVF